MDHRNRKQIYISIIQYHIHINNPGKLNFNFTDGIFYFPEVMHRQRISTFSSRFLGKQEAAEHLFIVLHLIVSFNFFLLYISCASLVSEKD